MSSLTPFLASGVDFFNGSMAVVFMIFCLGGIIAVILGCITNGTLKKKAPSLAIILSSGISCLLMIPLVISFINFASTDLFAKNFQKAKVAQEELKVAQQQIEALNKVLLQEKMSNESLSTQLNLAQSAGLAVAQVKNLVELNLAEVLYKGQMVDISHYNAETMNALNPLSAKQEAQMELLLIDSYDLKVKYGVDFKNIKIERINDQTLNISGIEAQFTGMDNPKWNRILHEVRKIYFNKEGRRLDEATQVMPNGNRGLSTSSLSQEQVDRQITQSRYNYIERLKQTEINGVNEAIMAMAQNFITMILQPVFPHSTLVFTTDTGEGRPLLEFLQTEANQRDETYQNAINQLNEQIALMKEVG